MPGAQVIIHSTLSALGTSFRLNLERTLAQAQRSSVVPHLGLSCSLARASAFAYLVVLPHVRSGLASVIDVGGSPPKATKLGAAPPQGSFEPI